jgi:uncharacterized protein YgbK (DUF1537 family)
VSLHIAYYGDDLTGSTDVLEVLASAGVKTVLYLERPDASWMARFEGVCAVGLAGVSRSRSPEWMDAHLPGIFEWMKSLGARVCHYKVCSTFDSAPHVGSIGRAIDIGRRVFETPCVPLVVGAPNLRRYVVFGNLFATVGPETFRIDRHPVMSRHPVTPMEEGDLRRHLALQTAASIGSMDLLALGAADADSRFDSLRRSADVLLLDTLDGDSLRAAGRLLWTRCGKRFFTAGSSGVEYALVAYWAKARPELEPAPEADRIAVMSGSCSAVTGAQIRWAAANGFMTLAIDAVSGAGDVAAIDRACAALRQGKSVVLYSAQGAGDRVGLDEDGRTRLAERSGAVLDAVIARTGIRRAVIAGGDTSSHAAPRLRLRGLEFLAPIAPGAPLCRAFSDDPARDGLEVVFKGGQCGGDSFFERVRLGKA